jgi:hypothetical protein
MSKFNNYFRNVLNEVYDSGSSDQLYAIEYEAMQGKEATIVSAKQLKQQLAGIKSGGREIFNVYKISGKVEIPNFDDAFEDLKKRAGWDA